MLSKFRKFFAANPFVSKKSLADKVAALQAKAEQEHATAEHLAQEAHFESQRLWAKAEAYRIGAARLKTLAEKLGDLIDPAA